MKTDLTVSAYIIKDNQTLLVHHMLTGLWLPPGGHIDKDETPDEALLREIKEELNLDIKILNTPKIPMEGNIIDNLAVPFYCNTHKLIDHVHYCSFYVCEPLTNKINSKKDEVKDFEWFSKESLYDKKIPADVRNIGFLAFNKYEELKK
jgi:8-oxo-dGTP diphosphatase